MNKESKIKVLAELDGFILVQATDGAWEVWKDGKSLYADADPSADYIPLHILPDYLTSYDAILPLIQKQLFNIKDTMWTDYLHFDTSVYCAWDFSPEQLADALIKAVGKWEQDPSDTTTIIGGAEYQ